LQSDPRPMLLGLVLQSNPLKFESCKFNVIIKIINMTLGSGVATKPKTLRYNFAKQPNTFINITLGSGVATKPKTLGYNFAKKPNTLRS
jgi:hypothetical protein